MNLKISVLLENRLNTGSADKLIAKPGLSLFIEDEHDSILFDTGPDGSFIHNAALMGIHLTNLTAAILSHGHYDHCGGVPWLPRNCRIVCHPLIHSERYSAFTFFRYSAKIKKLSLDIDCAHNHMEYSSTPINLGERFMWSGEIPVSNSNAYGIIGGNNGGMDYVQDEGALIYKSDRDLAPPFPGNAANLLI
ncbi:MULTISPECIES: MBL fold metallo-hydrolase [Enterobacteriaceae]|uniref:MBL fold metallo-hydrolase n=1 Tax=Cronobacter sakazakii TaxID=28141 RepID=A0A853H0J2_CROSK|nr:MBL fold metallo-hydrolase [Cronobacter sakazakii]